MPEGSSVGQSSSNQHARREAKQPTGSHGSSSKVGRSGKIAIVIDARVPQEEVRVQLRISSGYAIRSLCMCQKGGYH